MNTLTSRSYSGPADLPAMTDLAARLRAAGQKVYPIAADLYEELSDPDVQATVCLWEGGNAQLVGFAYVSQYQNLVDVFDQRAMTPAIETEMVAWAVAAAQLRNQELGEERSLDASSLDSDLPRLGFLRRHGFEQSAEDSILMARSLGQPIPVPVVPPGFVIRPMKGETEVEAYVALHRAAFGTENMSVAYRRVIMSAPSFIPELDLVAVAPSGELAAFCVCQVFPDDTPRAGGQKEGWTDPVGTRPSYQRLGLAKALILTGMHLLKGRGIDTALLGTSSENIAMQRTAEALDFRTASRTLMFSRPVGE
jgi:mycothiol synthase